MLPSELTTPFFVHVASNDEGMAAIYFFQVKPEFYRSRFHTNFDSRHYNRPFKSNLKGPENLFLLLEVRLNSSALNRICELCMPKYMLHENNE